MKTEGNASIIYDVCIEYQIIENKLQYSEIKTFLQKTLYISSKTFSFTCSTDKIEQALSSQIHEDTLSEVSEASI